MTFPTDKLLRNLDWNLLYTFLVIVEESSITGAAHRLFLSQPSVSNALKRLEEQLDMRLIDRKKGVFSLTIQGLRVYQYASSACRIISHMTAQFSDDKESVQGEIDIQIASYIHCPAFDQTLAEFHELYPKVFISINTQPSAHIVNAVSESKVNIGLSNKKTAQTGLRFDLLGYEKMAFYCAQNHPLYQQKNLQLEHLQGLAYVSFESDQPGEGLDKIAQFRAEQQHWGPIVAVSSNEEEVRRMIIAGLGFGALTVQGAKTFVAQGILQQLPPFEQLPINEIYLVTPENKLMSEVEKIFVKMLRKKVNESIQQTYFASK